MSNPKPETAAHSSRTLLRGGGPAKAKSFSSRKNSFCFASPALNPAARASARSQAEKLSFSFQRNFLVARANQNCKESFSARQAAALRRLAAGSLNLAIFAKMGSSVVV